ncbi:MAG: tRNA (guanosine(37)-N1)-methyltransferase TrmD [Candidatus Ryanbacteria bacterium]|nr:tRNA (guanosine(37)-N1)-methyltransferase TrmD [Candidatus Ryanbacteria bacterium]
MKFTVLTLFPKAFDSYLGESILKRAQKSGRIKIDVIDIRKFTKDKHKTADDKPYGGGPGMVMMAEPILAAVQSVQKKVKSKKSKIVILSAAGKKFDAKMAKNLSLNTDHLVLISGHYEGIDERVKKVLKAEEVSVGDYVLTGGELPAMVMIDAVSRHIPGVLGKYESLEGARYGIGVPAYTRPEVLVYRGKKYLVPQELTRGDHARIEAWRKEHRKKYIFSGVPPHPRIR